MPRHIGKTPPSPSREPHPLERPHALRAKVIRDCAARLGALGAQCYMVVRGADHVVRIHGCRGPGVPEEVEHHWRSCDGGAFVISGAATDDMGPVNHFAAPPPSLFETELGRWAFADFGYRRMLFTNLAEGFEHRGLIAFTGPGDAPFDAPRRVRVELAREALRAFGEAWRLEQALAPPGATVDLAPDGTPVGDPAIVAWAEEHRLAEWIDGRLAVPRVETPLGSSDLVSGPGCLVRHTRHADGGATCEFDRVTPMVLPTVLTHLTPAQNRVASLAMSGATVDEIAAEIGRSSGTVRAHLGKIYAALGVSSRAELADLGRRMLL